MKYLIGIFAISILSTGGLSAQEAELEGSKRERLEALKVAYLTKELDLTPEEAQQFWPIYNELNEKTRELRKEQRKNRVDTRSNFGSMTDAELSSAIQLELELEQQQLNLKKEYNQRFQKAIPIKKVAKLYAAEKGFRKELLKGARDKRKIPGGPPH